MKKISCIAPLVLGMVLFAWTGGRAAERPLRVAITPVLVERNIELNERLIGYIGKKLNRNVTIVQRKSYQEIVDLFRRKKVDVAFICSLPYLLAKNRAGMELLVVPTSNGKPLYRSYLIVSRNSPAKSIWHLQGALYAYPDPLSNSGYLYPRYLLLQEGFSPDEYFRKWVLTHSHSASIEAVSDGFVDGASVDSYIYHLMEVLRPELTVRTKIIDMSPPFGFPPVVVRRDLPGELKKELRRIFLSISNDEAGSVLLQDMLLDGFVSADDALFDSVREIYRTVTTADPGRR